MLRDSIDLVKTSISGDQYFKQTQTLIVNLRDRPPEFSKMKIFFGTSVSDTLKSVD